jgi:regulatory protein
VSARQAASHEPGDPSQRALELAYAYLNKRERTEAEVRRRLEQYDVDTTSADVAVRALIDHRALDDARYARLFIEDKRGLEQWGNDRIRRTLTDRGIDHDLIEHALAADTGEQTELDRAVAVLRARFPDPPRDRRERDRALGVLLRKGYDGDVAVEALAAHAQSRDQPET